MSITNLNDIEPLSYPDPGPDDGEVFQIKARRCTRCGGLLTSAQALHDGYGPCCLRKLKQEARDREELKNQFSLFEKED